jgi:hypothetical protein
MMLCLDDNGKLYVYFINDDIIHDEEEAMEIFGELTIDNFDLFIPANTINQKVGSISKIENMEHRNIVKIFDIDNNIFLIDLRDFIHDYLHDNLSSEDDIKINLFFIFDTDNSFVAEHFVNLDKSKYYPQKLEKIDQLSNKIQFKQIDIIDDLLFVAIDQNNVIYLSYNLHFYSTHLDYMTNIIMQTLDNFETFSFPIEKIAFTNDNATTQQIVDFDYFSNFYTADISIGCKMKNLLISVPYEHYLILLNDKQIMEDKIDDNRIYFRKRNSIYIYVVYRN